MLKISPKLIDVEGNRVGTTDMIGRDIYLTENGNTYFKNKNLGSMDDKWKGGRFPTLLFTNIKNKQFKYVKNIT